MSTNTPHAAVILDELMKQPVQERARWLSAVGDVPGALRGLIDLASEMPGRDASSADQATDVIVNMADRLGSQLDRARARRARARALSYAGRFDEALGVAREGIRLADEAGFSIEAGRSRLASMHALGELGRLEEAIAAGHAAREAFVAAGEPALAARADINLGGAYQRSDDHRHAIECLDRARGPLQHEPLMLGHLENNRGEAMVALNDFQGARRAFSAAAAAFARAGASLTAAIAEGNLADLAARQGHLQRAMFHFERARQRLESTTATGHLARLSAERAEAMGTLGMPREAVTEYEQALTDLDAAGLSLEAARARNGLGLALIDLGRWSEAETALIAAAHSFDRLKHTTARARTDLHRARIASAQGRYGDARTLALGALAALHDRPADVVVVRLLLAKLDISERRFDEAGFELDAALHGARTLDMPPLLADALFTQGRLLHAMQDSAGAIGAYAAAIAQVERVRGSLQSDRYRMAFLGHWSAVYQSLVTELTDQQAPDCEAALTIAEQAKSRQLLDQLEEATRREPTWDDLPCGTPDNAQLISEAHRLRGELKAIYSRMHDISTAGWGGSLQAGRTAVRDREERLHAIEDRLDTMQGFAHMYRGSATASEIRAMLQPRQRLVEYFIAGDELMALVAGPSEVTVHRQLASIEEIARQMEMLQFQVNRALRPGAAEGHRAQRLTDDVDRVLERLHALTFAPIADALSGQAVSGLTIVPHGLLHMMPFGALRDGRGYLVDRFEIHAVPSASLLMHLTAHGGSNDALVVGVADDVAPQIEAEARTVAEILGCPRERVLIGADATLDHVRDAIEHAETIHLACHGKFSASSPMASGLRLADRWLTVRDISELTLRAQLIVLSGCETGVNLVKAGDELHGLMRGLLAAGASSVLGTLWRTDDECSHEFMRAFYTHWNSGASGRISKGLALRLAQRQVRNRFAHPAFWAPFVLVGRA